MITQLQLTNWKSYEQAKLYIDPLTVLIGTNASGKSNALDALLFLQGIASGHSLTAILQGDNLQPPLRGGIDWAARRPESGFEIGILCQENIEYDYEYKIKAKIENQHCKVVSEQLDKFQYHIDKNGQRGVIYDRKNLFLLKSNTVEFTHDKKKLKIQISSNLYAMICQPFFMSIEGEIFDGISTVLKSLKKIFILNPIPSHMRNYSHLSEQMFPDASNIAGVLARLPKEEKQTSEKILSEYASRLPERDICRVYSETVGKFNSDAMLYCDERWCDDSKISSVDARGMSDGTLRFLAILTALLTRPSGSLLVIEEVDNGLHPSRAQLLLEMLNDIGPRQVIDVLVTTHNPALLDAMGTEMVPFITVAHRNPTTGCSELTLLEDIDDLPKLLAQGLVGRLSSKGLLEESLKSEESVGSENNG